MTHRSDTPTDAADQPHDTVDDTPAIHIDIDDLIAHLRAAHDAGATINELHARLGPILADMATEEPSLTSSSTMPPVRFPLPAPSRHNPMKIR